MHITPFKAHIPNLTKVKFDASFYEQIRQDFHKVLSEECFIPASNESAYFLIEIKSKEIISNAIVTLTDIQEYIKGNIIGHEQTLVKKSKLHQKLLQDRGAMIKPAALLIQKNTKLISLYNEIKKQKKLYTLTYPEKSVKHTIWIIGSNEIIGQIESVFKNQIKNAIIADGHHRFSTIAKNKKGQILTAYFMENDIRVDSFYRIINPLKGMPSHLILHNIQKSVLHWREEKKIIHSQKVILIHDLKIYSFNLPTRGQDSYPVIFNKIITNKIFKIKNEAINKRIHFEEPTKNHSIPTLTTAYPHSFIFILPPLSPAQVLGNHKLLPPKSTYFIPRVINGLVVKVL